MLHIENLEEYRNTNWKWKRGILRTCEAVWERFHCKPAAAWRECVSYQRLHLPPSTGGCNVNLHHSFFLNPSSGEHCCAPRGSVFVWERSCCKLSDAITVCISQSYVSTISSHIFHWCRVYRKRLRQRAMGECEKGFHVRMVFMWECEPAADVNASTISV